MAGSEDQSIVGNNLLPNYPPQHFGDDIGSIPPNLAGNAVNGITSSTYGAHQGGMCHTH